MFRSLIFKLLFLFWYILVGLHTQLTTPRITMVKHGFQIQMDFSLSADYNSLCETLCKSLKLSFNCIIYELDRTMIMIFT